MSHIIKIMVPLYLMGLVACSSGNKVASDPSDRAALSRDAAPATGDSSTPPTAAPTPTPGLRVVSAEDFATAGAATPTTAAPAATTDASPLAAATEPKTPSEMQAQLIAQLTQQIMDGQAALPSRLTVEDAKGLASSLTGFLNAAFAHDKVGAAQAWNGLNNKLIAIALKHSIGLSLYDNSTLPGKFLNGANSLVDVVVQLYGAVIGLDFNQALGAGQSAVRDFLNLFKS